MNKPIRYMALMILSLGLWAIGCGLLEPKLKEVAFVAPVLPGKDAALIALTKEALGPRLSGYEASRKNAGISRERAWLQKTPKGSMIVVIREVKNVEEHFKKIASSDSDFDKWFRAKVKDVHGLDLGADSHPPKSELVLDWSANGSEGAQALAFAAPLVNKDFWLGAMKEIKGARSKDLDTFWKETGISKEHVWLFESPMGAMAIVYKEGKDISAHMADLVSSEKPFAEFMRKVLKDAHGIDPKAMSHGPPSKLIFDWSAGAL